jgi:hypothetical protein
MTRALPRHEHQTPDNAPHTVEPQARHQKWVANGTHAVDRRLRRRSQVYRCIRLVVTGLRQVHGWYGGSTKDSGREEKNQNPTVSFHGHPTPIAAELTPADLGCQTR